MSFKLFITGTDTEVGKTYVATGLLRGFKQLGLSTIGLKPVASGALRKNGKFYNEDALLLQKASSIRLNYAAINPFCFASPISPNIAAKKDRTLLTVESITKKMQFALNYPADIHIIESIGGWFTPLNNKESMADFVLHSKFKVLLVVDIRLGCLNHAILTYQAIKNAQIDLHGWVANCLNPHVIKQIEIINTLKTWLSVPCLGVIHYKDTPETTLNFDRFIV